MIIIALDYAFMFLNTLSGVWHAEAPRGPDYKSRKKATPAEIRQLIQQFWTRYCHAREFYHLRDLDLIMANDEMCCPYEAHAQIIYELAGVVILCGWHTLYFAPSP